MKNLTLALALLLQLSLIGQSTFPFDVVLEPLTITNLPGMQSYAAAQHNGKWLIIGGRIDGLHQRQPWQAFNARGTIPLCTSLTRSLKPFTVRRLAG